MISTFIFSVFRVTLRAREDLHLPGYKGSAIRGSFGHTFRKVVCLFGKRDCSGCDISRQCIYAYLFETIADKNDPFLRNRDKAAHPYIIRPSLDEKERYETGEDMVFDLILVGRAVDYLPYFAYAFILMGEQGLGRGRGKFTLQAIDTLGLNGGRLAVYRSGDDRLKRETLSITGDEILKSRPVVPEACTLQFLTRLDLKEKGRYPEPDFSLLFRSLLRRIATLGHLHCGLDFRSLDFGGLSHAAEKIGTVTSKLRREEAVRYSNRQRRRMPFGGLLGEITFAGDLSPFWPFMLLGEWMHVGKKTSFGLGRYFVKTAHGREGG